MDELPHVMLGLRTGHKEDIGALAAELVYGAQLRLPADPQVQLDYSGLEAGAAEFAEGLSRAMSQLRGQAIAFHGGQVTPAESYIPAALATHVYICKDWVMLPLERPYEGPYRVLSRTATTVKVDRRGKCDTVAMERVKPAFFPTSAIPLATETRTPGAASAKVPVMAKPAQPRTEELQTMSGRVSQPPKRYDLYANAVKNLTST